MDRTLAAPGPEVGTLDSRGLDRLRRLGNLLDNSIPVPGTTFRFGLDTIIGLVPGVGDLVSSALSLYIVAEAARLGLPKPLLLRMGYNVAVDTIVGTVPLLGDLFDAGYKANLRNLALVQQHLQQPGTARRASRRFTALLVAGIVLLLVAIAAVVVAVVALVQGPVL